MNAEESERESFRTMFEVASGFSDSYYFLLLYGFGMGTLLFGLAFIRLTGLGFWLGVAMIYIGMLSLTAFTGYYLGLPVTTFTGWNYQWIYPVLQPAVRIGIGVWILIEIKKLPLAVEKPATWQ